MKYNVGDKVRIISYRGKAWNPSGKMDKWMGKVMTIREVTAWGAYLMEEDISENHGNGWCWTGNDIVEVVNEVKEDKPSPNEKIVIVHDGKTTTATLYRPDGTKETATARCAPEDTFDFKVGANLAMERLMGNAYPNPVKEYRVVHRKPIVGDYIRLKTNAMFHFNRPGDILKVDVVEPTGPVRVHSRNHPRSPSPFNVFWNYLPEEFEVVEVVEKVIATEPEKPEPSKPEYYNGKVVCVAKHHLTTPIPGFTIGKVYSVVDGHITSDRGWTCSNQYTSLEMLSAGMGYNFIPYVEDVKEENKPLTTEQLMEMDGKKVWCSSLYEDKEERFDDEFCGWYTVFVTEQRVVMDGSNGGYKFKHNDIEYGFRAYLKPPVA